MSKRLCVAVAMLLAGCALGPNYHRPSLDVPAQYRDVAPTTTGAAADTGSMGDSGWWEVYSDADLQALLATALENNFDVKIAVARIDQARATLGTARLNYLPQVSVDASAVRAKSSNYARLPGSPRINDEAQVQILASYQIDLWGQLRRTTEAARANLLASQYAKRAVSVTLVATLANAYFELISLDSQLEITRRTVDSREKFLELTQAQHERGYVTGLDVATAEADLAAARSTVPDLERQIAQTEDLISVLLGSNPGPVMRAHYGEAVPEAPPRPPPGLPAQLLERRPDVAQAEQGLVAANAEIGVAKAALFPNISLTGSGGSLSVPFGHLFTAPAAEWSAGVGLIQPLLSVQSNLYQVQLADARKREALYQYQKTVQGAFQDVADALVAYEKFGEQERQQASQVDALRRARAIALGRYRTGYASYFDVIQADRDLFTAELALAQAYANDLSALVHLYSALGGGWQERPVVTASPPATP
ncbi:MAG TPA: efflux transporter outer membrane subunit [Steroidobacteraceae bacterium]|jgi:multidrug efflux system outer membrane protein|nr:efflux transporter outer membrane subunit [Steroidobacteraceae bacterium]